MVREADPDGISYVYRYDGENWEKIQAIDVTLVNEVDRRLTAQLAETGEELFYSSMNSHKYKKPLMVLVDDDLYPHVLDRLKPVIEQEKVPISCAVITNRVGTQLSITLQQMKDLEKIGFNFLSHTANHVRLANLSETEIEKEMKESRDWLRNNGFATYNTAMVYPFGSVDERVERITRKYYKVGVHAGTMLLNSPPLKTYRLDRYYYNLEDGTQQIEGSKQKIDEAIDNGNLLILGMHCHYQGFDKDGLIEVIQYAKSKGIEIVSLEEALLVYGNIVDYNTPLGNVRLGVDGTGNLKDYVFSRDLGFQVDINTPLSAFQSGRSMTYYDLGHPNVEGFPSSGGVLETMKASSNHGYQTWFPYRGVGFRRRWWDNVQNEWKDFERFEPVPFNKTNNLPVNMAGDWTGQLRFSRDQLGYIHLRGIVRPGTISPNYTIGTVSYGYRLYAGGLLSAYNHTRYKRVDFYMTTTGEIRLIDVDNLAEGDSIRFNSLYSTAE